MNTPRDKVAMPCALTKILGRWCGLWLPGNQETFKGQSLPMVPSARTRAMIVGQAERFSGSASQATAATED